MRYRRRASQSHPRLECDRFRDRTEYIPRGTDSTLKVTEKQTTKVTTNVEGKATARAGVAVIKVVPVTLSLCRCDGTSLVGNSANLNMVGSTFGGTYQSGGLGMASTEPSS